MLLCVRLKHAIKGRLIKESREVEKGKRRKVEKEDVRGISSAVLYQWMVAIVCSRLQTEHEQTEKKKEKNIRSWNHWIEELKSGVSEMIDEKKKKES